jgi:hypothetical protein
VKPYDPAFYFILKYCVDSPMMVAHDRNKGLFPISLSVRRHSKRFVFQFSVNPAPIIGVH